MLELSNKAHAGITDLQHCTENIAINRLGIYVTNKMLLGLADGIQYLVILFNLELSFKFFRTVPV